MGRLGNAPQLALDLPPPPSTRNPVKISLGLGRHSVGMLVGLWEREEPVDAILFADTGDEWPETYAYRPYLDAWLAEVGYPPITVVRNASPIAGDASLSAECLRKSVLPSPAYGGKSCSLKWKVEPQRKWVAAWPLARAAWARGGEVMNLVGYDNSPKERLRAARGHLKWPTGHHNRYPLQEWGWLLEDCIAAIVRAGLRVPPKSACVMCPNAKKPEIVQLARAYPDLARRCITMESRAHARGLRTVAGLGRRFSWTDYLAAEAPSLKPA